MTPDSPKETSGGGEIAIYIWSILTVPWSPSDFETRGLGGSETAGARVAAHLVRLGYSVTVYGLCRPSTWRGVAFRPGEEYDPLEPRLATISLRAPEIFDGPNASLVRLLWLQDVYYQDRLAARHADRLDHVLVLTAFHAASIGGDYPFLRPKLRQVHNGLEPELFAGPPPARLRRVVYSSGSARGLAPVLEVWPRVRAEVPDAELVCCSDPVHLDDAATPGSAQGVTFPGRISQPSLVEVMRASLVWVHPSWRAATSKPFRETSCISAMEAQAAGCVVVASKIAALNETVREGRLIDGTPGDEQWAGRFSEAVVAGLTDESLQRSAQRRGPEAMREMTWAAAAERVAALIEETAGAVPDARARLAGPADKSTSLSA